MDVDSIGYEPGINAIMGQHGANDARLPITQLTHGVKQVRGHGGASVEGGLGGLETGVGMADADDDAGRGQGANLLGRHSFCGDGADQIGQLGARSDEAGEIGIVHRADQGRVVCALAGESQMRAFQMESDKARNPLIQCSFSGGNGGDIDLDGVGDQRRQQRRGAELGVCGADCLDGFERRGIVEQHPATAVHLQVNKARNQHSAVNMNDF